MHYLLASSVTPNPKRLPVRTNVTRFIQRVVNLMAIQKTAAATSWIPAMMKNAA